MSAPETETGNQKERWLRTEYEALADYYGRVITFRFSTAAFFIAAVAWFLRGAKDQAPENFVVLLLMTFGIWIVEIRNRAVFDNLLRRAWELEVAWTGGERLKADLPLFIHLTPFDAKKSGSKELRDIDAQPDRPRILWLEWGESDGRFISHTMGFDILYLSVLSYALVGFCTSILRALLDSPARVVPSIAILAIMGFLLFGRGAAILAGWIGAPVSPRHHDGSSLDGSD